MRLSNGFTGITPAIFTVPRKGDIIVSYSKEGYESADVSVLSQLSGAGTAGFVGNALLGGIIGGGVDIATGATLSHVPNPVRITLLPEKKKDADQPLAVPSPIAPSTPVPEEGYVSPLATTATPKN